MFVKGQKVTVLNIWSAADVNYRGETTSTQLSVQHLVVHSCGKKQMILATESGEVFKGRNYLPSQQQYNKFHQVLPRMSTEEALQLADALAIEHIALELAHVEHRLAQYAGINDGYTKGMEARRVHLHTAPIKPAALYEELAQ